MFFYRLPALVVVLLVCCSFRSAHGHSRPARPLKRLSHPSTLALEILPRTPSLGSLNDRRELSDLRSPVLRHSDSFRLILSAFDQQFHLHLRPNDDLIHPAARISYYHTSPQGLSVLSHSEPLLRESVKAYWGEVIPASLSSIRMREDAAGVVPRPSRHAELGWARIVVHNQGSIFDGVPPLFEGAFSVDGVVHHVVTKDSYLRNKHIQDPDLAHPVDDYDSSLVIWRDSDVTSGHEEDTNHGHGSVKPQMCGHDSLLYNTDPTQNFVLQTPFTAPTAWYDPLGMMGNRNLAQRDDVVGAGTGTNFVDQINNTASCPKNQKVVYMGVAADCQYTSEYGSPENATTQILTNWNTASALYKTTFNVSLGIIELQVQNTTCPSPPDPIFPWNVDCTTGNITLNERLSLFSAWRGQKGDDGAGLWHLMSGCPTGTEVGIAWLGTLCQQTASGSDPSVVSGTAVSTAGRTEWQVVAHEIGHNFGAIHDCADGCNSTSACCPLSVTSCDANSKFLMSPVAEAGEMNFSLCSLGNICSLMQGVTGGQTNTTCLVDPNPSIKTISLNMCGNGIVEEGEDCDPGQGTTSPCCDSATCKFNPGALCDPQSSPCCTNSCSFAPVTQVCRPSKDAACDTAETCTGNSSSCPADKTSPNGMSCGPGGLACASGFCTSLAQQCKAVGSAMNLQEACPSSSCQVSCQDPTQANTCLELQTLLIDGSPCGYGGSCVLGACKPGNLFVTAKAWYTQNLQISIPVSVVGAIILVLILWALISAVKSCCRAKRSHIFVDPALAGVRHHKLPSNDEKLYVAPVGHASSTIPQSPPVLRPGAKGSRSRTTTVAPDLSTRAASGSTHPRSQGRSQGNSSQAGRTTQFPVNPIRPPENEWVDETLWNGPRRA